MSTKTEFTAEEWNLIRRAPLMAGFLVVAASPSAPFGVMKEVFAVGETLATVKRHRAAGDLVKAIVADLETREPGAHGTPSELRGKTPAELRTVALEACRRAAAVVENKVEPEEAQAFKQWLVSTGRNVAAAAKEGGVFGIRVTEQETAALKDLASLLGVNA